jgi:hypothetical protein
VSAPLHAPHVELFEVSDADFDRMMIVRDGEVVGLCSHKRPPDGEVIGWITNLR